MLQHPSKPSSNDTLVAFLDWYITISLENILIYSDTTDSNWVHVRSFLEALSGVGLHLKQEKYKFYKEEVRDLGIIIGREGVKMDHAKVAVLQDLPVPQITLDV